mgnify:CR=1 FL=1
MIDADANLGSLVERKNDDPETKKPSHYKEQYHDFATGKKQRKFANHTRVSSTAPDATIVSRAGGYRKLCDKGITPMMQNQESLRIAMSQPVPGMKASS